MGSIDSAVSLLLAVTDLAAVRAVTKAINANLPKNGPLGTSRPTYAQLTPRPQPHYTPTLQPRPAPRAVVHPTPNFGIGFGIGLTTYNRSGYANPCCEKSASSETFVAWTMEQPRQTLSAGPFDAPWKHLPPVCHPESQMKVNLVRPRVDLITKGMLLDLFA